MSAAASPKPPKNPGGLHAVPREQPARLVRTVWSPWFAVLGVGVHFGLRQVLDPWLNAPSDAKFVGAVVILSVPLIFSVLALVRAVRAPRSSSRSYPPKKESTWH